MSILKNKKMITFSRDIIPTNLDETDALVTSIESDADDHEKHVTLKKSKTITFSNSVSTEQLS